MAKIKPFPAYRPAQGLAEQIASPPYDVLNSAEARTMAEGNPLSFLHVVKPEIDLDPSLNPYDAKVYLKGKENLTNLITAKALIRDPKPCFYIYSQQINTHRQIGLVVGASVAEYNQDLIKKHELTRKDKEDDRTRHVETLNANTGPVFLTYRARKEIDTLIADLIKDTPVYDFEAPDGVRHSVWVISDAMTIELLETLFAAVPTLYVADGHHRSASAARVGTVRRNQDPNPTGNKVYDYFLAVLFPHNQLRILDYNRVVKDLNGLTRQQFLDRIALTFTVEPTTLPQPQQPTTFGLYLPGQWYRLSVEPGTYPTNDPVASLDVSILQDNLLAPVLGILDQRTDKRIDFIGGSRGMAELEARVKQGFAAAFSLYPTTIQQLIAIADAGKIMPPKSTWFEPKLRSGLIVRMLTD